MYAESLLFDFLFDVCMVLTPQRCYRYNLRCERAGGRKTACKACAVARQACEVGGKRRSGGVGGVPCPPELLERLDSLERRLGGIQATWERAALALELLVAGFGQVHGIVPPAKAQGVQEDDGKEAGPSVIGPKRRAEDARPVPRPSKKKRAKFVDLADIERGMGKEASGESGEGKGKGKEREVMEVEGSDEEDEEDVEKDEERKEEEKERENEKQDGVPDSGAAS